MNKRAKHDFLIRDLRAFVAIIEHGNLTKAACELNVSQPAISMQLKRLERLAGGRLFVKTARRQGLSEVGLRLEQYARRIVALNDQALAAAGRSPIHRTLYVGVQGMFARVLLPDLLCLRAKNAKVNWEFHFASTAALTEKYYSGSLDLLVMVMPPQTLPNVASDWIEELVWVSGPRQSLLTKGEPIPLIAHNNGHIDKKVYDTLTEKNLSYRIALQAADSAAMIAAALAGVGIFALAERCVPSSLAIVSDSLLPKLPQLRVAVFYREGLDVGRFAAEIETFIATVRPAHATAAKRRPSLSADAASRS